MNESEKLIFMNLIESGRGLSYASEKIGKTPEYLSNLMQEDHSIKIEIEQSMSLGIMSLMDDLNQSKKLKDYEKAKEISSMIDSFISKVVLWKQFDCFFSVRNILLKHSEYKNIHEVATGFGKSYSELYEVILSNPELSINILKN